MRIGVMPHFEHDERFGRGEEGWDGGEPLGSDAPRPATPSNANLDGRVRLRDVVLQSICHGLVRNRRKTVAFNRRSNCLGSENNICSRTTDHGPDRRAREPVVVVVALGVGAPRGTDAGDRRDGSAWLRAVGLAGFFRATHAPHLEAAIAPRKWAPLSRRLRHGKPQDSLSSCRAAAKCREETREHE